MTTYSDKLRHPKWQRKRLEALQRDDFTCQLCSDTETELQVHHLKYQGEPHDAPLESLQTLCKHCHHTVTRFDKANDPVLVAIKLDTNYFAKTKSGIIVIGKITNGDLFLPLTITNPKSFLSILSTLVK